MFTRAAVLRPVVVVLAASLLLAACGSGSSPSSSAKADSHACPLTKPEASSNPGTQLTPQQADQVVRQIWQQWDRQNQKTSSLDCQSATVSEEGPSLAMSVTSTQITSQLGRPSQDRPNPIQKLNVYVPRLDRYPLWFFAIASKFDVDQNTGKVGSKVVYRFMAFTRMREQARWKAYLATDTPGGNPKVALDAEGYAAGQVGPPVIDPAAIPTTYIEYLRSAGAQHSTVFAPGTDTDQMAKQAASVPGRTNTFDPYDDMQFTVPMRDGSQMVVFTGQYHVHLTAASGSCYNQDAKRSKMPIYFPPGKWKDVDISSAMVRIAFVPSKSGQIQLTGDDGLILSKGSNPC